MREIIINKNEDVETVCLIENGKLIERYVNDTQTREKRLEGNIYVAEVADLIKGMQAAFVDYGDKKKGLLHFKDAIPQIDEKSEEVNEPENADIEKILKKGQKILIQIKKDSNDKKGAKVSTHISIPSKYVAFMPNTKIITISQKIEDEKRKEELLDIARKNVDEGNGIVIRTSSINANNEDIIKDISRCTKKWKEILTKYKKRKSIGLIWNAESIQEKMIIDLKIDKIITNSNEEYKKLNEILKREDINTTIELNEKEDLLNLYDIKLQMMKTQERKIWLNCGGFIAIDKTEALTAIDVNTGKYTGNKNLESTVYRVNKEATMEIAKQLRLRDIGGIIIIDYIDMKEEKNKQEIENLLKEVLKEDRAKTQVEGFTKLNLMEMTRKHICSHLDD